MILFPNAKINLGLRNLRRRADGYHDLVTGMMPVDWCDILELVPARGAESTLTVSGNALADCPPEKNLVFKALRATERAVGHELPTDIYLRKIVPDGAGLGGGSSDAAFTLKGLNELHGLGLGEERMAELASEIGSDCPFFIYNRPMLAEGRGTELRPVDINLEGVRAILVAKPEAEAVSTREAYAGAHPREPEYGESIEAILSHRAAEWRGLGLRNDFEESVFPIRPAIKELKERMLDAGAVYAAMTGSGAAVTGLFPTLADARRAAEGYAFSHVTEVR